MGYQSKLTGDDGEIFLLQWLSETENDLKNNTPESFKTSVAIYESKLLKVITGAAPYPTPGRPFRTLAARCMVLLYSRGESRTMFDTMQTLLKVVGDMKAPDMDRRKV